MLIVHDCVQIKSHRMILYSQPCVFMQIRYLRVNPSQYGADFITFASVGARLLECLEISFNGKLEESLKKIWYILLFGFVAKTDFRL